MVGRALGAGGMAVGARMVSGPMEGKLARGNSREGGGSGGAKAGWVEAADL